LGHAAARIRERTVNLPNLISLARLLAVPVVVWLLLADQLEMAFWLFVAAGASDAFDGFIAKRFDMATRVGRYLDPLADKALLVSTYIALGRIGELPDWLVILVVSRDLLIVGGFMLSYTLSHRFSPQPATISKINTALQMVLAAVVLGEVALVMPLGELPTVMIVCVAATTVASGTNYLIQWTRGVAQQEEVR